MIDNPYDINGLIMKFLKKQKKLNSVTENSVLWENILLFLSKIDTNILRDLYINKIYLMKFGLDKESLKEDYKNFYQKIATRNPKYWNIDEKR